MDKFNQILEKIDGFVWGAPLIILILFVGIYFSVRMGFLQVRFLPAALRFMFKDEEGEKGEVSSFGALCTSLSATIGTGNIVGVATAIGILAGGPGALFWMWIAAFFGMATKYAEGFLAIKYRNIDENGHVLGGPFYYIENGMGKKWKWLGKLFAVFGGLCGLIGIGTFSQVNGISTAVNRVFDPEAKHTVNILGAEYTVTTVITAVVLTVLVFLVVIGGLKRISSVSTVIVPFMAVLYIVSIVLIIVTNISKLPSAVAEVVESAFGIRAFAGGATASMAIAMQKGIARGIFSNESGLGSAPIAAAAARSKDPVRQGLVSMTGTFFDTIVICTMTGLAIVMMGSWKNENLEGAQVSIDAFQKGMYFLPEQVPALILTFSLVFFAFTTILGWNYYGERCVEYLFNKSKVAIIIYRWLYIIAVFIGPYMTVKAVWTIADIVNGLMAFPNLIALISLSPIVIKETNELKIIRKTKNKRERKCIKTMNIHIKMYNMQKIV